VMVSESTEEAIALAWASTIPVEFRYRPTQYSGRYEKSTGNGVIILPPPPQPTLDRWFQSFAPHLTAEQKRPFISRFRKPEHLP
jgi:hypothetical protein